MSQQDDHSKHSSDVKSHHHILPEKMALGIFACLLVLTAVTVIVSRIDLGVLNFPVAMLIASIKALLVALFFMGLWYDTVENSVIFSTSFVFLAIFITFTATDLFFRGDVYVKAGAMASTGGSGSKSKLKSPWISTPQLVSHGKELFEQQCVTCHGTEGLGNGPASSGYKPSPRNFHATSGWVNGRKPSNIFKTLKEGVSGSGMASFSTLPVDDRWALAAYVVTFNPEKPPADTQEDLTKIGYNLATGLANGGAEAEEKTIPVDFTIERMASPERPALQMSGNPSDMTSAGAQIFSSALCRVSWQPGRRRHPSAEPGRISKSLPDNPATSREFEVNAVGRGL